MCTCMPAKVTYVSCCHSSGNALDDFYMVLIQKIHKVQLSSKHGNATSRLHRGAFKAPTCCLPAPRSVEPPAAGCLQAACWRSRRQWWANLKSNLSLKSQIFFTGDLNLKAKSQILNRISHQNLESSNSKSEIKSQITKQQIGFNKHTSILLVMT